MDKKIKYEIGDRVRYVTDGQTYKGIVVDKKAVGFVYYWN